MVKLGSKVKDLNTGFEGIAIARAEWLYGCARIRVRSQTLHEGKPLDDQWFDEESIEVVTKQAPKVSADNSAKTGGPHDAPRRAADPKR